MAMGVPYLLSVFISIINTTPLHNRFMAPFPGPPGWAGARRELLDFMMQGKINRGKHIDQPAGRHSIWTKQCPPPPSPPSIINNNISQLQLTLQPNNP